MPEISENELMMEGEKSSESWLIFDDDTEKLLDKDNKEDNVEVRDIIKFVKDFVQNHVSVPHVRNLRFSLINLCF